MSELIQINKIPCGNYICNNFLRGFELSNLGIHIVNRICEHCSQSPQMITSIRCFYCYTLIQDSKKKNICRVCDKLRGRTRRFNRKGITTSYCRGCGIDITKLIHKHKYCSRSCQMKFYELKYWKPYRMEHRKTKDLSSKECKHCNKIFMPKRMGGIQIYCTNKCNKEEQYKRLLEKKNIALLKRGGEIYC